MHYEVNPPLNEKTGLSWQCGDHTEVTLFRIFGQFRPWRKNIFLASFCLENLNGASWRNYVYWGTSNKPIPVEIDRQEV